MPAKQPLVPATTETPATSETPVVIPAINIQATDTVNIGALAEIEIFDIKLMGKFEKDTSGMRVLVAPGGDSFKQTVYLEGILKSLGVSPDSIKNADSVLKYVGLGVADTAISINQAFFYYTSVDGEQVEYTDKRTKKDAGGNELVDTAGNAIPDKKAMEYALSISIDNTEPTTEADTTTLPPALKIKKIGFAVWNTTRQPIKDSLGMSTIESYLTKMS
jgi:hypothetical protein